MNLIDLYIALTSSNNNNNRVYFIQIDVGSDNDDNSSDETLSIDKTRPASLDKMIALVATLVERSRGPDLRLQLSPRDYNAIAGGKVFCFLHSTF